jgi:hypothetical protein
LFLSGKYLGDLGVFLFLLIPSPVNFLSSSFEFYDETTTFPGTFLIIRSLCFPFFIIPLSPLSLLSLFLFLSLFIGYSPLLLTLITFLALLLLSISFSFSPLSFPLPVLYFPLSLSLNLFLPLFLSISIFSSFFSF